MSLNVLPHMPAGQAAIVHVSATRAHQAGGGLPPGQQRQGCWQGLSPAHMQWPRSTLLPCGRLRLTLPPIPMMLPLPSTRSRSRTLKPTPPPKLACWDWRTRRRSAWRAKFGEGWVGGRHGWVGGSMRWAGRRPAGRGGARPGACPSAAAQTLLVLRPAHPALPPPCLPLPPPLQGEHGAARVDRHVGGPLLPVGGRPRVAPRGARGAARGRGAAVPVPGRRGARRVHHRWEGGPAGWAAVPEGGLLLLLWHGRASSLRHPPHRRVSSSLSLTLSPRISATWPPNSNPT